MYKRNIVIFETFFRKIIINSINFIVRTEKTCKLSGVYYSKISS